MWYYRLFLSVSARIARNPDCPIGKAMIIGGGDESSGRIYQYCPLTEFMQTVNHANDVTKSDFSNMSIKTNSTIKKCIPHGNKIPV